MRLLNLLKPNSSPILEIFSAVCLDTSPPHIPALLLQDRVQYFVLNPCKFVGHPLSCVTELWGQPPAPWNFSLMKCRSLLASFGNRKSVNSEMCFFRLLILLLMSPLISPSLPCVRICAKTPKSAERETPRLVRRRPSSPASTNSGDALTRRGEGLAGST